MLRVYRSGAGSLPVGRRDGLAGWAAVEIGVEAVGGEDLCVGAALGGAAVLHNEDPVGVSYKCVMPVGRSGEDHAGEGVLSRDGYVQRG
jgi:hypothetical protein